MRIVTRQCCLLLAITALVGMTPAAQAQSVKFGVFDSERVFNETIEGKRLRAEMAAMSDRKKQQISTMDQTIQGLQQQLNEQALSLSVEKRSGLEMEIRRKSLELRQANELAGKELQLEVAAARAGYNEKLVAVVEAFGRDEQFDLLVDRSVVAWASPKTDITTAIIDRFNNMFPAAVTGQ